MPAAVREGAARAGKGTRGGVPAGALHVSRGLYAPSTTGCLKLTSLKQAAMPLLRAARYCVWAYLTGSGSARRRICGREAAPTADRRRGGPPGRPTPPRWCPAEKAPAAPQVRAALDRSHDTQEAAQAARQAQLEQLAWEEEQYAAGATAPPPYDPVRTQPAPPHARVGNGCRGWLTSSCGPHADQKAGSSSHRPPPPPDYDPMVQVGQLMKAGPPPRSSPHASLSRVLFHCCSVALRRVVGGPLFDCGRRSDEGLSSLSRPILVYMKNPYR